MTNQFTDEQVGAGAKALFDRDNPGREHALLAYEEVRGEYEAEARATLEAAAGVAPQAESAPTSKYISPHLPSMIRNLWKSDPSENSVRTALKLAGDLIQELIDLRAAPVQPSSTVDEDALAEVIRRSYENEQGLKIRDDKRTARAVAEWLRGESR